MNGFTTVESDVDAGPEFIEVELKPVGLALCGLPVARGTDGAIVSSKFAPTLWARIDFPSASPLLTAL